MATPVVANTTGASIKKKKSLTGAEQMALARGQLDPSTLGPASDYNSRDASRILATQYTGSSSGSARGARSSTNLDAARKRRQRDDQAKAEEAENRRIEAEEEQRRTIGRTPTKKRLTAQQKKDILEGRQDPDPLGYQSGFDAFTPADQGWLRQARGMYQPGGKFDPNQPIAGRDFSLQPRQALTGTEQIQLINGLIDPNQFDPSVFSKGDSKRINDARREWEKRGNKPAQPPNPLAGGRSGTQGFVSTPDDRTNTQFLVLDPRNGILQQLRAGEIGPGDVEGSRYSPEDQALIGAAAKQGQPEWHRRRREREAEERRQEALDNAAAAGGAQEVDLMGRDDPPRYDPPAAVAAALLDLKQGRHGITVADVRALLNNMDPRFQDQYSGRFNRQLAEFEQQGLTNVGVEDHRADDVQPHPESSKALEDRLAGKQTVEPFESSEDLETRLAGTQTVEPIELDPGGHVREPIDDDTTAGPFGANLQEISDKLARGEKLTDQEFAMLSPEMQERVPQNLRPDYTAPLTEDELWNEWTATQGAALQGLTGAQISAVRNGFRSGGAEGAAEMLGLVGTGVLDDTSGVAPEDPPPVDPPPEELSPEEIIEQEQEDTLGSVISDFLPDPIDEDAPEDKIYDPTGVVQGKIDAGEELTWEEIGALDPDARIEYLRDNFGEPDSGVLGEIRDKLSEIVAETGFDADEELQRRNERTAARYASAREKLARQFGIDPGGPKTGRAARAFEQLSIAELAEVSETESEIARMAEEVRQTTLVNLTNSLAAIGGLDLETAKFGQTKEEFDQVMDLELKKHGLNDSQIQAVIRQIDASIDLDRDIFDQRVSEELRRFGLDERQIDETIRQMSLQGRLATKASNLESRKFNQSIKEQLRRYELDEKQITAIIENLTAESTLDEEKFKQQKTEELRRYGLDKKQIDEIVRQMGIEGRLAMKASNLESRKFKQTTKEFTETLELELKKFGLSDQQVQATIRQIDADIANSTRETSANIGQNWASILGFAGTETGEVDAEMLGVDLSALPPNLPGYLSIATPTASVVKASFQAMMGRAPTGAELATILEGSSVTVEGVPTMESRKFASTITQQEMDRAAKYTQMAEELGLDERKFTRLQEDSDRDWNLMTGDVAAQFGLDEGLYQQVRFELDNELARIMIDPNMSIEDRQTAQAAAVEKASKRFPEADRATFLQANSLFEQTHGEANRNRAIAAGMEMEKYLTGQAMATMQEEAMLGAWASLMSEASQATVVMDDIFENSTVLDGWTRITSGVVQAGMSAEAAAEAILENADPADLRRFRAELLATPLMRDGDKILSDEQFRGFLEAAWPSAQAGFRQPITFKATDEGWFWNLKQGRRDTFMNLLAGAGAVPERQRGTWWEQILMSGGQVAAAYFGRTQITNVDSGDDASEEGTD